MVTKLNGVLDRLFKLSENKTNVRTEFIAGLTTFMTMAYIIIVNPSILSAAGMDHGAVFTATIVSTIIATLCMAFLANYPFALAPGMGLNAYFAFVVVGSMGKSFEFALTAVLLEGIIFIVISFFKVREAIFDSIPAALKKAVSVGIGLFIALIGMVNGGLVIHGDPGTVITKDGNAVEHILKTTVENVTVFFGDPGVILKPGDFTSNGAIVTLIGLIVIGVLLIFKVKGALLWGILAATVAAFPLGVASLPQAVASLPPSLAPTFMKFEWTQIFTWEMLMVLFSFLFVDIFDTIGTLTGVASKTDMFDKDGKLPRTGQALLSDAIGTVVGACLGTSTVTTYVESSAGVAEGGRTGLTSVFTSIFFALALFFAPILGIVPTQATAPALIMVGLFMMSPIKDIDFNDYAKSIPAFLTIIVMPFCYSIAEGIAVGMIAWVILHVLTGKYKEVSITMYILAALFVLRYIFL